MELYVVVKGEYADFTILGIFTDRELAEVRAQECKEAGPLAHVRIGTVTANVELDINTGSI